MSRILVTWELGLNLGHLTRLLPVAATLKARGHAVVVAARDPTAASYVLSPAEISFVQAPYLASGHPLAHRPAGYADILRAHGWGDAQTLHGLVECWRNLCRMFRPDIIVADYSPSAVLTAHIVGLPYVLLGNGFEIPPALNPLPPFPGFSWATVEQAAQSEALVIENANRVARAFRGASVESLRDIVSPPRALFATIAELDHYGERVGAQYIGPLIGHLRAPRVDFPVHAGPRVFACVRPDTVGVMEILGAFKSLDAAVLCAAPGFGAGQLEAFAAPNVRLVPHPVELAPLLEQADLCLSYGAEGTAMSFLLAGVPQVVVPHQVEAHLAARRVEALGVGVVLRDVPTAEAVREALQDALARESLRVRACELAARYRELTTQASADLAADFVERSFGAGASGDARVGATERVA